MSIKEFRLMESIYNTVEKYSSLLTLIELLSGILSLFISTVILIISEEFSSVIIGISVVAFMLGFLLTLNGYKRYVSNKQFDNALDEINEYLKEDYKPSKFDESCR